MAVGNPGAHPQEGEIGAPCRARPGGALGARQAMRGVLHADEEPVKPEKWTHFAAARAYRPPTQSDIMMTLCAKNGTACADAG